VVGSYYIVGADGNLVGDGTIVEHCKKVFVDIVVVHRCDSNGDGCELFPGYHCCTKA
jgi:hypothetical protein